MERFKTLLLREWMQHQRGWLILMLLPLVITVVLGLFGQAHFDVDDDAGPISGALPAALVLMAGLGAVTLLICWGASLIQSPGLARRDSQDRSIEFWLSLPAGHLPSVGATLLAHLLLLPWAALLVGTLGGLIASLPIIAKVFGFGAWFALPWFGLLAAVASLVLRLALGVLLATLWLSPLILLTMAASAWFKRWGVPLVAGVLFIGGALLDRLYGNPVVWRLSRALAREASMAFFAASRGEGGAALKITGGAGPALGTIPGWCLSDAASALGALASPLFFGAIVVAIGGFALLVLRRQRGA